MGYCKDIEDVKDEFGDWANKTFPQSTEDSIRTHFAREAVELVGVTVMEEAIRQTIENNRVKTSDSTGVPFRIYTGESRQDKIPFEIADCVLLLMHLCFRRKINLHNAIRDKFEINRNRKWGSIDAQGVVEHVRKEGEEN